MAVLARTVAPLRALRCARRPLTPTQRAAAAFSASTARRGGGGGHSDESPYDPPGGWLWGIKPGTKTEPEGWEWPMAVFVAAFGFTVVGLAFRPDTSVGTWALEEARRRLEAEGILPDPFPDHREDDKKD